MHSETIAVGMHNHRAIRRTPQACATCRRRKTKCDGARPRCRYCTSADVQCVWPNPYPEAILSPSERSATTPISLSSAGSMASPESIPPLPSRRSLQRCFDWFFSRHFTTDFCSFDYRPDFEDNYEEKLFLVHSIVSLCARYLTDEEAMEDFGLPTAEQVQNRHTIQARSIAKATSDEPTVAHIQGNLVLALSELLSNSGSRHWMYSGTAIRMAQIMRLNKEYHQKHSLKEQEIRRRVFWACFLFDRALASLLCKPQTLSVPSIVCALPSTDASLAYQEGTRGLMLDTMSTFGGYPSDIGLLPYLVKTIQVWSSMADFHTCRGRAIDKFPPTDPHSRFHQYNTEVQEWATSLPLSVQWSLENYRGQFRLGQGLMFLTIHLLLRSAQCVAHQGFLPQLDSFSVLQSSLDNAGWSYLHREPDLVKTCVSSSLAIGEILALLVESDQDCHADLQSVWVAISILSAANTFFWIIYSNDQEYSTTPFQQQAASYIEVFKILGSRWQEKWKVAKQWLSTLGSMQAIYRAAYLGDINEQSTASLSSSDDETAPSDFRPRPGDGFPAFIDFPDLHASIRVVALDSSAKPMYIKSVWLQLSSGWPCDHTGIGQLFPES